MFYGAVAAFGLTAVQNALVTRQYWLHLVGGLFLVYLGIRSFVARPTEPATPEAPRSGWLWAYLSTLGLTLTNPATIISFTLIFAGLRLAETDGSYPSAISLVAGVFLGSAAWWLTLTGVIGVFRERFTPRWLIWGNRLAGTVIFGFGVVALLLQ